MGVRMVDRQRLSGEAMGVGPNRARTEPTVSNGGPPDPRQHHPRMVSYRVTIPFPSTHR